MATNDFFLKFGSNAADFSGKVSADLDPAISSIYKLAQALADYDEQSAKSARNPGNPIANTLSELDRAASEFKDLGSTLASTFQETLSATHGLATELASLVESIKGIPGRTKKTAADLAALKISDVTNEDLAAANKKRTLQGTVDTLTVNSTEAQRQLQRVATANATVARNAEASATALQNMGKGLREVLQIAKDRGGALGKLKDQVGSAGSGTGSAEVRISNGTSDPVLVRVVGGDLDSLGTVNSGPSPAQGSGGSATPEHHRVERPKPVEAKAEEAKGPRRPAPIAVTADQLIDESMIGKSVALPGRKTGRFIGWGARPDETVGQYGSRVDDVRAREREVQKSLPTLSAEDKELLKVFQMSGGQLAKSLFTEIRQRPGSTISGPPTVARMDIDRARGIAQMGAMTPEETRELTGLVQRMNEIAAQTVKAYDKFVAEETRRDPAMTQDSLGQDAKAALRRYDRVITEGIGAQGRGDGTNRTVPTVSISPEDRAGAENRRRIAERGMEAEEQRKMEALAAKAPDIQERRDARRTQSEDDIDDIRHNTSLTAPINNRAELAGLAGARLANARDTLSALGGTNPNDSREMANAERLVQNLTRTIIADLDEQISRASSRIGRLRDKGAPGQKINAAQRDQFALREQRATLVPQRTLDAVDAELTALTKSIAALEKSIAEKAAALQTMPSEFPEDKLKRSTAQSELTKMQQRLTGDTNEQARLSKERARVAASGLDTEGLSGKQARLAELTRIAQTVLNSRTTGLTGAVVDNERPEGYRITPKPYADDLAANPRAESGSGGKPPVPPIPPAPPTSGSNPEPEPEPGEPQPTGTGRPRRAKAAPKFAAEIATLDADTQALLATVKSQIKLAATTERKALVSDAAKAFLADPATAGLGDIHQQRRVFAGSLGLASRDRNLVGDLLPRPQQANSASTDAKAAEATARQIKYDEELAGAEGAVEAAIRRRIAAELDLVRLEEKASKDPKSVSRSQLERAQANILTQQIGVQTARDRQAKQDQAAQPQTPQQKLFGTKGFVDNQIRHIGLGIENVIGYSLVFTGFEKFKELVHTGLEADAVFVRLQSSLNTLGMATGTLRTQLAGISSDTATPLQHVIEASSELVGMFSNTADLAFGTKIAAQLANISQGTLTAKEAAIGLRDVIDAYGADWEKSGLSSRQALQQTGDQIAALSQKTGVGVKDILEGTTQFAQEAHDYHLTQGQSSTLAAYASQATGEPGKDSAAQTSRFLATLNSGKVQKAMVDYQVGAGTEFGKVTSEDFASGNMGGVLDKLLAGFDKLSPSAQQAIRALSGTGIQARVFSALMHDGTNILQQFNDQQDNTGALARQNSSYLRTVAGALKQLDEDFQNLGNSLAQIHAFDVLGGLAKTLDLLLKAVNGTFGRIADIANKSPFGAAMLRWGVVILELVAAFKLLGGVAATGLGKMNLIKPITPAIAASEGVAAQAAVYRLPTPAGMVRALPTPARMVRGAGSGLRGAGRGLRSAGGGFLNGFAPSEAQLMGLPRGAIGPLTPDMVNEDGTPLNRRQRIAQVVDQRYAARTPERTARIAAQQTENGMYRDAAGRMRTANGAFGREASSVATEMEQTKLSRALSSTAVASSNAATAGMGRLNRQLNMGTAGMIGMTAALVVVGAVVQSIMSARAQDNTDYKTGQTAAKDLNGTSAADAVALNKGGADPNDPLTLAAKRASSAGGYATFGARLFTNQTDGNGQMKGVSDKYQGDYLGLVRSGFSRINIANKVGKDGSPERRAAIQKAMAENDADIANQTNGLIKESGNKQAQTQAAAELTRLQKQFADTGNNRLQVAKGLSNLDVLAVAQIGNLRTFIGSVSGLSSGTLESAAGLVAELKSDTSIDPHGKIGKAMDTVGDGNKTITQRNAAQQVLDKAAIDQGDDKLHNDAYYKALGKSREDLKAQGVQAAQDLEQLRQAQYQNPIDAAAGRAGLAETSGDNKGQISALTAQTAALNTQRVKQKYTQDDPRYWANLKQIEDAKIKIAQLLAEPAIDALQTANAGSNDASFKAANQVKMAQLQLAAGVKAGLKGQPLAALQQGVASANLAQAQNAQQIRESQAAAQNASIRSGTGQAAAQLTLALQQEAVYRSGALKDDASYNNAVAQEKQARIALSDATHADASAVYDAAAALSNLHGDAVTAATQELAKAYSDYNYAAAQYGAQSQQALSALSSVYSAQAAAASAQLDKLNAGVDLQIAQLNARGQTGDANRAASLAVQKARNALASYKSVGGKTGTSQYDKLAADLATAQRTQFDTALNAQLDTLDFQKETFKITSSQEVQSLQQILKNKQLTLDEQRKIILKIKDLQESLRQQLTEGGLNIPSNIKLPSAYDVRRSLGAGFAGNATQSNTVNNNQRVQVAITNSVPTAQIAAQITSQVIAAINQQTGQSVRASSSTPRLVPTR